MIRLKICLDIIKDMSWQDQKYVSVRSGWVYWVRILLLFLKKSHSFLASTAQQQFALANSTTNSSINNSLTNSYQNFQQGVNQAIDMIPCNPNVIIITINLPCNPNLIIIAIIISCNSNVIMITVNIPCILM